MHVPLVGVTYVGVTYAGGIRIRLQRETVGRVAYGDQRNEFSIQQRRDHADSFHRVAHDNSLQYHRHFALQYDIPWAERTVRLGSEPQARAGGHVVFIFPCD